jgi:hypothetical protein
MKVQFAKAGSKRVPHDFYPTPPEATLALLPRIASWPDKIWEPMCGTGAMSEVLIAAGKTVISSDPFHQGYGDVGKLFAEYTSAPCPTMVTNPPFDKAAEIIEHARAIGVTHLALLLKAQFWHAKSRIPLFLAHPPAWILPLTWRLDWDGRGSPTMDCSWCLWTPNTVETRAALLSKPKQVEAVPQERPLVRLQGSQASLVPLLDAALATTGDSELDMLLGLAPAKVPRPKLSEKEVDEIVRRTCFKNFRASPKNTIEKCGCLDRQEHQEHAVRVSLDASCRPKPWAWSVPQEPAPWAKRKVR